MRPAFSVLFLTTLIGVGQGLLLALVAAQVLAPAAGGRFFALGAAVALAFLGLGLFASFFHLANPQRAWRAAARWRTSWLSREVVALPVVMALAFGYGIANWLEMGRIALGLGLAAAAAALALFLCTGMIYACVRFIREWAGALTVVNYTLMGAASGFTLAAAYAGVMGGPQRDPLATAALGLTLAALAARGFQSWRNARMAEPASLKSAIGVHHAQIRQVTQGFCGASFNTKEFTAPGGREILGGLTVLFLGAAFVLPALFLAAGLATGETPLLILAFAIQYPGLLTERWVFFAQGRHVQNMYYQRMA